MVCEAVILVDAVISDDVAVFASTLQGISLEILQQQLAIFLYQPWSSVDSTHKGFITWVMVSINHIYCIVLHHIGSDLIPQNFVFATQSNECSSVSVHQWRVNGLELADGMYVH